MSWHPARIGPDHATRVGALTARLSRERHGEIPQLHRGLFGEPLTAVLMRGNPPGITVNSALDRHARLTILATMSDADEDTTGLSSAAEVLVSVAGHHRQLDRRVPVDPVEEEAWARLTLGPDWQDRAYRQLGHLTQINGQPGATFYGVFPDTERRRVRLPQTSSRLRTLTPLGAAGSP